MRTLPCPSDPVPGPRRTASDGALGTTPAKAFQNARRDAPTDSSHQPHCLLHYPLTLATHRKQKS